MLASTLSPASHPELASLCPESGAMSPVPSCLLPSPLPESLAYDPWASSPSTALGCRGKHWELGWPPVQIPAPAITGGLFNFSEPQLKNKIGFIISASRAASKDKTKEGLLIPIDDDSTTNNNADSHSQHLTGALPHSRLCSEHPIDALIIPILYKGKLRPQVAQTARGRD